MTNLLYATPVPIFRNPLVEIIQQYQARVEEAGFTPNTSQAVLDTLVDRGFAAATRQYMGMNLGRAQRYYAKTDLTPAQQKFWARVMTPYFAAEGIYETIAVIREGDAAIARFAQSGGDDGFNYTGSWLDIFTKKGDWSIKVDWNSDIVQVDPPNE